LIFTQFNVLSLSMFSLDPCFFCKFLSAPTRVFHIWTLPTSVSLCCLFQVAQQSSSAVTTIVK
jgi:hypothetical protein